MDGETPDGHSSHHSLIVVARRNVFYRRATPRIAVAEDYSLSAFFFLPGWNGNAERWGQDRSKWTLYHMATKPPWQCAILVGVLSQIWCSSVSPLVSSIYRVCFAHATYVLICNCYIITGRVTRNCPLNSYGIGARGNGFGPKERLEGLRWRNVVLCEHLRAEGRPGKVSEGRLD